METAQPGMVYLIGAGPGDPGLLTLRGAEVLRQAEVVIYDGLVNRELLGLAPPGAELIYGGKHDRHFAVRQEELNQLMVDRARAGRRVVRLKGGDPFIFGRGGEEAGLLAAAGLPWILVPGVSSVHSVPGYAGIPLTHRDHSSQLVVVTGHENPLGPENRVDWPGLARLQGTLVVLMGLKNLPAIAQVLLDHGRPAHTPVAVISHGTRHGQRTLAGTLATIASQVEQAGFQPPSLTVIGEVVQLREQLGWFERRPLFGQRIVVTQRPDLASPWVSLLQENGAEVLPIPATRWEPHPDREPLDRALAHLGDYDWLLFSHPFAVDRFFQRFHEVFPDWRQLGAARLAAYGPRTAARLRELHLQPAAVAADHLAPLIIQALRERHSLPGQRFLLLRGGEATEPVPEALAELGATVEVAPVYSVAPDGAETEASRDFLEAGADWLVFASGLAIQHFHQRFNLVESRRRWPEMKVAITRPTIGWALEELALQPQRVAGADNPQALLQQLIEGENPARHQEGFPGSAARH